MLFSLMILRFEICLLVTIAARVHPVTYRTRKLSSHTPMVLGGEPPGRVGHCQETFHLNLQKLVVAKEFRLNLEERGSMHFV